MVTDGVATPVIDGKTDRTDFTKLIENFLQEKENSSLPYSPFLCTLTTRCPRPEADYDKTSGKSGSLNVKLSSDNRRDGCGCHSRCNWILWDQYYVVLKKKKRKSSGKTNRLFMEKITWHIKTFAAAFSVWEINKAAHKVLMQTETLKGEMCLCRWMLFNTGFVWLCLQNKVLLRQQRPSPSTRQEPLPPQRAFSRPSPGRLRERSPPCSRWWESASECERDQNRKRTLARSVCCMNLSKMFLHTTYVTFWCI